MPSPAASETLPGLAVLEQTPIILERLASLADDDQLTWKPAPERWSISEVLAHLADVEIPGFRGRIEKMAREQRPRLEYYDQEARYAAGAYSSGRAREHLKRFCHERDRSLAWLRFQPAELAARQGEHERFGPITVAQLMNEWAFHDLGHIRQVAELLRARAFFPHMGPFQHGYAIRP